MNQANLNPNLFRRLHAVVCGIFCFCLLFLLSSCKEKKTDSTGYSDAFKPIFKRVGVLFSTNQVDKGLYYLDSAVNQIKPTINDKFRVYGFHYLYWKKVKGNNQKALLYADSMLSLANKSATHEQYMQNYVEANLAIGDVYFDMQQFDNAYQHYFVGYTIGRNNLNNRALSDYAYRMGMIMYKMGQYQLAAGYFKESLKLNEPTDDEFADFYRRQEDLDNIALSYKHNNQLDSAIIYFDKTLNYIQHSEKRFKSRHSMIEMAAGVVYGNKAEVLISKRNYKDAVDLLKKSIAINLKKDNDHNDAELAEIKLAQVYYDQNQNDALIGVLDSLRLQLNKVKNKDAEANWNKLMSNYYLRKNDLKKSISYLQTFNVLKDSNISRLNLLKESNVNEQLANYEKQYQINKLQSNNKIQQIYLYILVAGAFMGFVIIALIFRNWKRSKRDIKTVNDLNKQVNNQKIDLEKTLEELKSSSLEKDRILRAVAHDLRNPIGGISSLARVMAADDDYTEDQLEMINLIKETSTDTLELINEILEVTNNGESKLNMEPVDINSLVNKSIELLRFKAAEKDQEIKLELLDSPQIILVSREKIWRVISNLISNAIKFSPFGGIIYVQIEENETSVQIAVKDTGIGIPDELKDKVFHMFSEAKRPGTAGEKSFGLGLSISKQIMESHNGDIWFESVKGKGTTFYLKFLKTPVGKKAISENQHTTVPNF